MMIDKGYRLIKRHENNEFHEKDPTSFQAEMILNMLKMKADWDQWHSSAVVNCVSLRLAYRFFGSNMMTEILDLLVKKDLIEIISLRFEKFMSSYSYGDHENEALVAFIKIKHFPREHLKKFGVSMMIEKGYRLIKRHENNEFHESDKKSYEAEMILNMFKMKADWDYFNSSAVVNCASFRLIYRWMGSNVMDEVLKLLVEKDMIEIISLKMEKVMCSNGEDGMEFPVAFIKIKHFPREHLG
jgi:hypothetical protein